MKEYNLAQSIWPRSGQDRGNRSNVNVAGPSEPTLIFKLDLPQHPFYIKPLVRSGGLVVVDDGSLRAAKGGILSAVSQSGELIWSKKLLNQNGVRPRCHSAPVALNQKNVLITLESSYLIIDEDGNEHKHITPGGLMDDSGPSPNLTQDGCLIITEPGGEVSLSNYQESQHLGYFGYDIVPPAIFDDGSLAVSGYAYKGYCRIELDGQLRWQTKLKYADLLPTINHKQVSVVGSFMEKMSGIFSPDGEMIGQYEKAAVFAEYVDDQWIALSHKSVARLNPIGEIIWQHTLETNIRRGSIQPIVDQTGRIYIAAKQGIICFDADGSTLFIYPTQEQIATSLSMIGPSRLAAIIGSQLIVLGSS